MLRLFNKLKLDLVLLDDALPSGRPWEGRAIRPGSEAQVAFVAIARPLALAVSQVLRNVLEGPLAEALETSRTLSHDKMLSKMLEARLRKLCQAFETQILRGTENGIGAESLEIWLDALEREASV